MKTWILALMLAFTATVLMPTAAEAKRIGGGSSSGMQRSLPSRTTPTAAPTPSPAQAPGVAPKRSWMGPIAGIAAGLGIAALMGHLGWGGEMGNFLTLLLIAGLAFFVIRFLMRRFAPSGPRGMAYANPAAAPGNGNGNSMMAMAPPAIGGAATMAPSVPSGFDAPAFERIAKMIFIRMQTANDAADLNDLRAFTTPEMFAAVKMDLQDRNSGAQQTDVVRVDASVLDVSTEAERQIVSVRFHGLIREERGAAAESFDEVWHLVRPVDGSREWAIAGIQQTA